MYRYSVSYVDEEYDTHIKHNPILSRMPGDDTTKLQAILQMIDGFPSVLSREDLHR